MLQVREFVNGKLVNKHLLDKSDTPITIGKSQNVTLTVGLGFRPEILRFVSDIIATVTFTDTCIVIDGDGKEFSSTGIFYHGNRVFRVELQPGEQCQLFNWGRSKVARDWGTARIELEYLNSCDLPSETPAGTVESKINDLSEEVASLKSSVAGLRQSFDDIEATIETKVASAVNQVLGRIENRLKVKAEIDAKQSAAIERIGRQQRRLLTSVVLAFMVWFGARSIPADTKDTNKVNQYSNILTTLVLGGGALTSRTRIKKG